MSGTLTFTGDFKQSENSIINKTVTIKPKTIVSEEFYNFFEAVSDSNGLQENSYDDCFYYWDNKRYDTITEMIQDFYDYFDCDDKETDLSTLQNIYCLHFDDYIHKL